MIIRQYLDGIEVHQSNSLDTVTLNMEVTPQGDKVFSYSGDMVWGNGDLINPSIDPYLIIKQRIEDGVNGGIGVAQAMRAVTEVEELGRKITVLDAMIDIWGATIDEEHREITTPIIERGGADWIAQKTEGVSFEYLRHIGLITNDDIILVPYVIEKQNQTLEKIMCLITGIVLFTQIREQISQIQQIASDTASSSPWVAVLKIAIRIAYVALLIKTLIDTVLRLINLLIQPIKYCAGMSVRRHFEILFGYLGFSFESTIFAGDEQYLTIFPEKYSNPINKDLDGITGWVYPNKSKQNGYFKGYGYEFCQIFKEYYNAKFIVDETNNIIRFERRDYVSKVSNFASPTIWQKWQLNKQDYISNHYVKFQTDINDRHTVQEYEGVSSSVNISPINTTGNALTINGTGKTVSIPFSLFKIKTELSQVEELLKVIFKSVDASLNLLVTVTNATIAVINGVISLIKKILQVLNTLGIKLNVKLNPIPRLPKFNLGDQIDDRIGIFKMEDDIVYQAKIAYVKPVGNDKNNRQLKELRAEDVQENYHAIDFFTRGNQYRQGSGFGIAVSFDDIYDIIHSDVLNDGSEIVSLQWQLMSHEADFVIKEPYRYLNCLTETKVISDGY